MELKISVGAGRIYFGIFLKDTINSQEHSSRINVKIGAKKDK
jgi:hypothetical protein|tara:strand:- start:434 stop:559 length:126 start_codon:yes stop_codon:yes gene_type:complete